MKIDKNLFLGIWDGCKEFGFILPITIFIYLIMIPIAILGAVILKDK